MIFPAKVLIFCEQSTVFPFFTSNIAENLAKKLKNMKKMVPTWLATSRVGVFIPTKTEILLHSSKKNCNFVARNQKKLKLKQQKT